MPHFFEEPSPIGYHAMRLRWCRLAVHAFLRRWSVYLVVLGVLFSAGSVGALSSVSALAAWLVLPLFYSAAHPAWLLPVAVVQVLLNLAMLWGLRALVWRPSWAEAERALPLRRDRLLRSDATVAALALAPLFSLQVLGAVALLANHPPWLQGARWRAVAVLGSVLCASLASGVLLLWRQRLAPRPPAACGKRGKPASRAVPTAPVGTVGWPRALVWLPLLRGPARRTARGLLGASALLCAPAAATFLRPGDTPWWLAAYLLAGLLATSRLQALARLELDPLWSACAMLPLAPKPLHRMRLWCALAPAVGGGLLLLAALPWPALRPGMLAAFAVACAAGHGLIVLSPASRPATEASRWLFFLALGLVLASEVMTA